MVAELESFPGGNFSWALRATRQTLGCKESRECLHHDRKGGKEDFVDQLSHGGADRWPQHSSCAPGRTIIYNEWATVWKKTIWM